MTHGGWGGPCDWRLHSLGPSPPPWATWRARGERPGVETWEAPWPAGTTVGSQSREADGRSSESLLSDPHLSRSFI